MNVLDIKIVRLKTGEDVIGCITDIDDDRFNIFNPMLIDIMSDVKTLQQSFVMKSWLPFQLFKTKEVSIWTNDTLFVAEATDDFVDYYVKMVEKIDRYIAAEEIMDEMSDDDLYDALMELDEAVVH